MCARACIIGTLTILAYEWPRHWFKSSLKRSNRRRLYTGAVARLLRCRHPNYFGEIVSFCGFALVSKYPVQNLWVPLTMGIGLALYSVPELEHYLALKYKTEWPRFVQSCQYRLVPGVF